MKIVVENKELLIGPDSPLRIKKKNLEIKDKNKSVEKSGRSDQILQPYYHINKSPFNQEPELTESQINSGSALIASNTP